MAQQTFFEGPVDRTPYGSCVGLATVVLIVFCMGVYGLWKAADYLKQHQFQLPTFHSSSANTNVLQAVQSAATTKVQHAAASAEASAETSAGNAAKAQVQAQATKEQQQVQASASTQLNNYLSP